jgi:RNA polymerase sigma-70 factor (ECF subfamily)
MTPLQRGAVARFEELYVVVRDPLARYLARRAAPDAVEDLFAEVMTVAWRRIADIPQGAELPWLYGTARRVLANHRRAGSRFGRLVEKLALLGRTGDPAGLPPRGDPDLADALALLSAADAEILRLWAWEELAPAEIAVVLGVTPNAASIRLHRAKGRLRDRLEDAQRKIVPVAGHVPGVERKEAR